MKRRAFLKKISVLPVMLLGLNLLAGCDDGGSSSNGGNSGQSTPNPTPTPTPPPTPGQGKACLNGGQSTVMPGGNPSHTHGSTTVSAAIRFRKNTGTLTLSL